MMERLAYALLGVAAIGWLLAVAEFLPFTLMIISGAAGIALLIIKVITEQLRNKEDKHYSKTVKK
jgi:hypothetical protein